MYDGPDIHNIPISTPLRPSSAHPEPPESENTRRLSSVVATYSRGLPATSGSIFRLNELLSVTPVDLAAVNETVRRDPSIAAHVLQLANSCSTPEDIFYTLPECLVLIGVGRLRNVVLTTPMAPSEPGIAAKMQALWQHSELTALIGRRIAHECGHPEPQRAYLAGLLHDIGKIPELVSAAAIGSCASTEEHCSIGSWLATLWNLPSFLVDAIEHHHAPDMARRDPFLVAITAAANQLCLAYGVGLQGDGSDPLSSIDRIDLLHRHLSCLNRERTTALADLIQMDFLRWVESPSFLADGAQQLQSSIGKL